MSDLFFFWLISWSVRWIETDHAGQTSSCKYYSDDRSPVKCSMARCWPELAISYCAARVPT